jgi:hypothetical protein
MLPARTPSNGHHDNFEQGHVLSKSPTTVVDIITTELLRPRDQIATKALPQFVERRSAIARLIRRPSAAPLQYDLTQE